MTFISNTKHTMLVYSYRFSAEINKLPTERGFLTNNEYMYIAE